MTTHPPSSTPAIAQVLRVVRVAMGRITPSPVGYDFGPAIRYLDDCITEAELEAPEREAAREVPAEWFRKKPIPTRAVQATEGSMSLVAGIYRNCDKQAWCIRTLEGEMTVTPGDWVVTGIRGEKYPVKPDIFAATYEPCAHATPTETPPPAWDAQSNSEMAHADSSDRVQCPERGIQGSAPGLNDRLPGTPGTPQGVDTSSWDAEGFVREKLGRHAIHQMTLRGLTVFAQAAYTEGQRAALVLPERRANADTINLILSEAGVTNSEYLAVRIAETFDPPAKGADQ